MNKLRTTSWFLILVILLATLVSLTVAQEAPTAGGDRLLQHEPLSGAPLAQSAEETRIELSTSEYSSLSLPAVSLNLAPTAADGAAAEPPGPVDTLAVEYPHDLSQPRSPKAASPVELELVSGVEPLPDFSGRFVGVPQPDPSLSAVAETCKQLLGNPALTVSSGGSIAPWVILEPKVYYDDSNYTSAPTSLLVEDNDSGDASPTLDSFAQSFSTPSDLTKVTIKYSTASLDSNTADKAWGNLYTVTAGGALDQFLGGWEVGQSPDVWQTQTVTITDPTMLQKLEGEDLAIILFGNTTGSAPGEVVFFDDVTLTACAQDAPDSFIIVQKKSAPTSATQKFTFDPSWSGANFQLKHNESKKSPALAAGTYSVVEVAQSGWKLSSATCSDGSSPNNISLQAGETVTCTFRNTKDAFITIKKETSPAGASQKFTFDPSWSGSNFQLSDGQSKKSAVLSPGTYSVKELAQSGWSLSGATCSDGSNPNNISLQAGETVTCTFKNVKQSTSQSCQQMIVNYQLDVNEFDDSSGTAEPWIVVEPIVWYTKDPAAAYDGFSLFLADGDVDNDGKPDPSPAFDMFAQGFQMPGNLTEIVIEFRRATINSNSADKVYGELWKLDDNWVLHLGEPEKYYVAGWDVAESEGAWAKQTVTSTDSKILSAMAGQKMAILLFNVTDNGGTKELVLFDNVMLSACTKSASGSSKVYMPATMNNFGKPAGPVCNPPSENPADNFFNNRGLVQAAAMCSSTMSSFDTADYYTFKPTKNGNHTLHLTNLPAGTEWAAMIFIDQANPDYAPGGAPDGRCRITQPGNVNKQVVCNLSTGKNYVVKVSAGSTPVAGGYKMKITAP